MCGIVGIISKNKFSVKNSLQRLKKLEYRGYDSFGYYYDGDLERHVGEVIIPNKEHFTNKIICHTRWATHGGVTEKNAHPHLSCDKKIAIVHNGIIENYQELKFDLQKKGHIFTSETDSEVIAHYFEEKLKNMDVCSAIVEFFKDVHGEFAIVMMIHGDNNIYAIKRDSPLVLGTGDGTYYLASDIYAFSDTTNNCIFFENDEFAIVSDSDYQFYDKNGNKITKKIQQLGWTQSTEDKQEYDHFMIKEIMEEPTVINRLIFSLQNEQKENLDKFIKIIKSHKKVTFVAAGSSYHASLFGVYLFHKVGINAQTLIASEFDNYVGLDDQSVVIAISQSGETMDVIEALKYAKNKGAKILSIVNVPYSTIQRMSEVSLNIYAGQEVCVAATKTFINQVILLLYTTHTLGLDIDINTISNQVQNLFINKDKIIQIAEKIYNVKDLYILGRGIGYPIAREIALKIKEICYIHAEGMMGGELKHGTIALIENGTVVLSIMPTSNPAIFSNTKEVEARGAIVIKITNNKDWQGQDNTIFIDTDDEVIFSILSTIIGQILTYYIALKRGNPIDKPRNLAKSVTVK